MVNSKHSVKALYLQDEEIGLPDKIHLEELKYDKVMKENKELVLRCKELDIRVKTKESHCANLQLKATEDGEGFVIF